MARLKGARDRDYEEKRARLLHTLRDRLSRTDETQPSMRQLAEAAGVSLPTLRHYFGSRQDLVAAVFGQLAEEGRPHVARAATPTGAFEESIRAWTDDAFFGLTRTSLGDMLATGLVESLHNTALGPAFLEQVLEPTLEAIAARLAQHQAAGEMRPCEPRHAALILLAPLLLACHHQRQLGGAKPYPMDLAAFAQEHARAFVRGFGSPAPGGG